MKRIGIKFLVLLITGISVTKTFAQDTLTAHDDYIREQVYKGIMKRDELLLISLGGGLANPTGSFKNTTGSSMGGTAMLGYFTNASATLKLSDNFGFSLGYLYQNNKFDETSAKKVYGSPTKGGNWLVQGGFAGISFFVKSTSIKNLSLCLNASSGYVQCVSPKIEGIPINNGPNNRLLVSLPSAKASSIAFLGSMGFLYKFNENIGIHLTANYLQTTPEFKGVPITRYPTVFYYYSFEQKITSLNMQLGLSFFVNHHR